MTKIKKVRSLQEKLMIMIHREWLDNLFSNEDTSMYNGQTITAKLWLLGEFPQQVSIPGKSGICLQINICKIGKR